ncbi:MAG: extracellular solute-binding protein, partial [Calditrichia bacterium]|nr:extracellular solute-binding protein [Calditrichia bacterium]
IKPALESCYFNEKFVSAPFYIDVGLMYYRDDITKDFSDYDQIKAKLDRGITWQELIALKKEKDHLSNPFYLFAGKDFEGLVCSFIEGLMSQDSLHFYKDTINLNTSVARKSLQLLVDLIHKYKLTPEVVTKFDEVNIYRYALKNDAIFFRGWPGLHWHEDPPEDIYKLKYIKMTHLPHFKGKSIRSVYGGWNLMISKFSQKKHEALIFIKFLLKEENQKLMYENGGLIPVNKNVYSDSLFMHKNLILKKYKKLLEKGGHRPFRVDYTRISDILSYYIHRALKKEISVNEALNKATNKINSQESMVY